jgi:formamidopyrimidine-DNA glycosylase
VPELPDVDTYVVHLQRRIAGACLEHIRLASPFVLRSVEPPLREAAGKVVRGVSRMGKRIVITLEGDLALVIHLMIAGRLRWRERGAKIPGKLGLAAFDFTTGTLLLTEASTKKRASLHLVRGEEALRGMDPGGIDPLSASLSEFAEALRRENHTLKRSLTDPRLFSGIGNAYSDEILWAARMSPVRLTQKVTDDEIAHLREATRETLERWRDRLLREGEDFPEKVTAFREGMAVHGRYRKPCPACGSPVQRIAYAENEANYCARCQTGGKLLADRSLSRLMHDDWPRTLEELEARQRKARDS